MDPCMQLYTRENVSNFKQLVLAIYGHCITYIRLLYICSLEFFHISTVLETISQGPSPNTTNAVASKTICMSQDRTNK